jgi:PAS domain S-box-containing protein
MDQASRPLDRKLSHFRWSLPIFVASLGVAHALASRVALKNYGADVQAGFVIVAYALAGLLLWLALPALAGWFLQTAADARLGRDSEARRLAAIVETSGEAIVSTDDRGRMVTWNRGAERLLGYRQDEIRGRPLSDLLGSSGGGELECRWLLENVAQAGQVFGHETTAHDSEGGTLLVSLTASALRNPDHRWQGMSLVLRDVTSHRKREEEIRRTYEGLNKEVAERTGQLGQKVDELAGANLQLQRLDQMRSEFVSLVTHQIRAPLTNMAGAVSRMQSGCSAVNSTCGRMFVVLNQQVERLDHLVGDVLSAARIEAGELVLDQEPLSIFPVIEQVLGQAEARLSERHVQLPTKPGLPLVFADRDRAAEILANFLDNADKYSPPGADIVVDLRADQSEVVVSMRDHGPGLKQGDLSRVFEKFYRSDGSDSQTAYGYGLGLYVCRLLAEAQGGRVWVENHPEGGAVFSLALPVWQDEDARSHNPTYR